MYVPDPNIADKNENKIPSLYENSIVQSIGYFVVRKNPCPSSAIDNFIALRIIGWKFQT